MKQALLAASVLGLVITPAALRAQGSAEKKVESKQTAVAKCHETLLKGVVNLDNNDVRFRTAGGLVVLIDPLAGPSDPLAAGAGMAKPDLILITHSHGDHFVPEVLGEYIKANPGVVLAGPEDVCKTAGEKGIDRMTRVVPGNDYEMAGINFTAVPAYFTNGKSHPKENGWVGYVLKLDGASYYVTGDSGPVPETAELKADVIFPLLWGCGGNVDQAVKMVELSKASLAVPVHHGGHIEAINKFMAGLPKETRGLYFTGGKPVTVQ
ncbi:MAG: MBL fold metallo-hydrolase [Candidatus Krumholzibacteria bacterium]|nr:MBL fold metallo-hydrolase [Candidatus Krumholzibacteria bacterium]